MKIVKDSKYIGFAACYCNVIVSLALFNSVLRKDRYIYVFIQMCCLLLGLTLKAQQGNIWYFGSFAGVSFNGVTPSAINDNQLSTLEGTSVMCDADGKLLFYTNGRLVFNRDHDLLLNGDGLKGHPSTYQSSIIIPKPGSSDIYYIFTADAWENNGNDGYCYSEVDMKLDNGLGAITNKKNVFLAGPSSERLTAVRAADLNSYWVITNEWGSNVFRAYKVDCNGVSTNPVVSIAGKAMDEDTYCNIGALRVSPDGKHIIQTNVKGRRKETPTNEYAQLFDFDDVTGRITNDRFIPLVNDGYYFGAEFSPDSRLVYIVNTFTRSVHQYDISSGNLATIVSSKMVITGDGTMAGISIGPDQKIYLTSGGNSLHVINQPNVAGPGCGFVLRQLPLTASSQLALPNIIPNLYTNRPVDFSYLPLGSCGGSIQFASNVQIPGAVLNWDFGDGNTGTGPNQTHTYANADNEYIVKLTVTTNNGNCVYQVVSKRVRPAGEKISANFGLTADCEARTVKFSDSSKASGVQLIYKWDFGDGLTSNAASPTHTYAINNSYPVRLIISTSSGCVSDTMDQVVDIARPVVNAGPDVNVTDLDPVQLNATGAVNYKWTPSTYLDNPNIANPKMKAWDPITYVVTGVNAAGCSDTDTLKVTLTLKPAIEVPNAFRPGSANHPVLRPILRMARALNYFQVYNRWGQMIFSTNIIGAGWDGTYKGLPQPNGAYVWVLEAIDVDGNIVRKRGSSILIR